MPATALEIGGSMLNLEINESAKMERVNAFDPQQLEAIAKILGDTNTGLTGSEIGAGFAAWRLCEKCF